MDIAVRVAQTLPEVYDKHQPRPWHSSMVRWHLPDSVPAVLELNCSVRVEYILR